MRVMVVLKEAPLAVEVKRARSSCPGACVKSSVAVPEAWTRTRRGSKSGPAKNGPFVR
jgi:hypothetical protein